MINGTLKQDVYNGLPCMRETGIVTSQSVNSLAGCGNCAGCIGAASNNGALPMCADLENADRVARLTAAQDKAGFDPVRWLKDNKLTAGGIAIAAYFILFKK